MVLLTRDLSGFFLSSSLGVHLLDYFRMVIKVEHTFGRCVGLPRSHNLMVCLAIQQCRDSSLVDIVVLCHKDFKDFLMAATLLAFIFLDSCKQL